jgi:phospholipase/carboxylesterase
MQYRIQQSPAAIVMEPRMTATSAVIWLHGLGADGSDFVPLVPELRLSATLAPRFIFPHAPVQPVTINGGMPMRAWYDIYSQTIRDRQDDAGIRRSAQQVEGLIQQQRDQGIAARHIVLAGFSQGGAIVLHTGLRHSERLGGILALSTYLPLAPTLAAEAAPANRALPILMCHGTADPVITLGYATQSRDALLAAGYPLLWKQYPMQHQVCEQEIGDISHWLTDVLAPI